MLNDSGLEIDNEFLEFFIEESSEVIENLKKFVSNFNGLDDRGEFEKYGQQIDRIMGAAYTLSLNFVGDLSKMGKELGYKSSQLEELGKLLVIQSLLSQLVHNLESILKCYRRGIQPELSEYENLLTRLTNANSCLGNLRATVKL